MNALDLSNHPCRGDASSPVQKSLLLAKRRRGGLEEEEREKREVNRRVGEVALPAAALAAAATVSPAPSVAADLAFKQSAPSAGSSKLDAERMQSLAARGAASAGAVASAPFSFPSTDGAAGAARAIAISPMSFLFAAGAAGAAGAIAVSPMLSTSTAGAAGAAGAIEVDPLSSTLAAGSAEPFVSLAQAALPPPQSSASAQAPELLTKEALSLDTDDSQSPAPALMGASTVSGAAAAASVLPPVIMAPVVSAAAAAATPLPEAIQGPSRPPEAKFDEAFYIMPARREELNPLFQMNYEQFSALTSQDAKRISTLSPSHNLVLGIQANSLWHYFCPKGVRKPGFGAFHFTIDHSLDSMKRAYAIIVPELLKIKNSDFKIIPQEGIELINRNPVFSRNAIGKECVFFEDDDPRDRAREGGVLMRIVKKLNDAHIPKGRFPLCSSPVEGGKGYLYFRPIRNIFRIYANPVDLAAWDFTRRDAFFLFPADPAFFPLAEGSVYEEDPWMIENAKHDWNDPNAYVDLAIAKMIHGDRTEKLEDDSAKWFEELVGDDMTLKFYIDHSLSLRKKALKELQVKDQDYPLGCFMPAVYYGFIEPMHYQFFFKGIRKIDLNRPLAGRPDLEMKLIVRMTACSLREKGVQYFSDHPIFIPPVYNKFRLQGGMAVNDWLESLLNQK